MYGDASTKGISNKTESIVTGPGKGTRGKHEKNLSSVEALIVREVTNAV